MSRLDDGPAFIGEISKRSDPSCVNGAWFVPFTHLVRGAARSILGAHSQKFVFTGCENN